MSHEIRKRHEGRGTASLEARSNYSVVLMLPRHLIIFIILACTLFATGCVHHPDSGGSRPPLTDSQVGDRHVLAGKWDYIDSSGAEVPLMLDEEGNGHYAWKNGYFKTQRLVDHIWSGRWVQKGNDREGGFRVKLAPDFSEGEGQWWYSRIGNDKAPTLKGGTFRLRYRRSG